MTITPLYALPLVLLVIVLGLRVVMLRRKFRIGINAGDNRELAQAIRVHGNAVESIPLALVAMALAESAGTWPWLLHAAGALLVIARAWHAIGLGSTIGVSSGRVVGMTLTWTITLVFALAAVVASLDA